MRSSFKSSRAMLPSIRNTWPSSYVSAGARKQLLLVIVNAILNMRHVAVNVLQQFIDQFIRGGDDVRGRREETGLSLQDRARRSDFERRSQQGTSG
jgi:hypothetical protein